MPESLDSSAIHRTIEAIWKIESAKVVAVIARTLRGDLDLAEDVAQDALVSALEQWTRHGIPDNPAAWLTAVGNHKAIDIVRRHRRFHRARQELARDVEHNQVSPSLPEAEPIEDSLLRLIFTTCHPVLSDEARSALALRLLCGLSTGEIARAFLTTEPTIAQRIVRAKRLLNEKQVPFEVPSGRELAARLSSVLQVIYLLFNEGYSATSGDDWMRPALCEEALRIGRILSGLMPGEPEVHGLVALMEIQASRTAARTDKLGKPILLLDQDRTRWDRLLIRRGLSALETSRALGSFSGPYALQASIAACHAQAGAAADTDWRRIASLYADLALISPSPIVHLNRAVAVGMADGPQAGLEILDTIAPDPLLAHYHLLPSVRGDFLFKLGRLDEARAEFRLAASLTRNARERSVLLERADDSARSL